MNRPKSTAGHALRSTRVLASRAGRCELEALEARQLMAADPVTPDNPSWVILPGEATVDGVLNEAAWQSAYTVTRAQAFQDGGAAVVKFMYGQNGLFIAWDVKDKYLWSDGTAIQGALVATANRWEIESDDSMTIYFDPNNSRDELFQTSDRAFGVNLGSQTDFEAGGSTALRVGPISSPLALAKFIQGNIANPSAPGDVNPGGSFVTGTAWKTVLNGTINSGTVTGGDIDVGWTTEMFLPWEAMGLSGRPTSGTVMGMNFDIIFDNSGSTRDQTDYRSSANRFDVPHFIDDNIVGVASSYHGTLAGLRGPVNYAQVTFIDPSTTSGPAQILSLNAVNTTGYSTQLTFTSPAAVSAVGNGAVSGYQIRYSTSSITTESQWLGATEFKNAYVPRLNGLSENLRVIGLTPATTYHVVVRAVDAAGNLGPISADATFTTQAVSVDATGGKRIVPSPMGRTFVNENGQEFIPVGDHLGLPWFYTRNLYTGDIYNPGGDNYINFNTNPSYEGTAGAYFDQLQSKGINTMRLYTELMNYNYAPKLQPNLPYGVYALESKPGVYNGFMKTFIFNVLQQASARGIYIIISPFDTYSFDEAFNTEFPWSAANGGPLTDINNFFQTSQTLQLAKNRMKQLVDWVNEPQFAPYRQYILGWEPMSEWDSYEWTLNSEGDAVNGVDPVYANPGREAEMQRRAVWMEQLGAYIKSVDPTRMVLNSTIVRDPRGPLAREIFNGRTYDALTPHYYTISNSEPINNPDSDLSIRPAVENAGLTAYWQSNVDNRRPLINGEWGNSRFDWETAGKGLPSYSSFPSKYNEAIDNAIVRTMMWSGLASGQAGMGLRISTDELGYTKAQSPFSQGYILTDVMRNEQKVFASFVTGSGVQLDFSSFNFDPLTGRLTVSSAAGKSLLGWGSSDRAQGVVYVMQDTRQTSGSVTDGKITITGLLADQLLDIEFWSTAAGTSGPLSTTSAFVARGTLTLDIPSFTTDMAIKFKARTVNGQAQRIVSRDLATGLATFALDVSGQPIVTVLDPATNNRSTQDIAAITGFTGRILDMTVFVRDGLASLAATDTEHNLWLFQADISLGNWTAVNLTTLIGAPGLTGDLTTYQPSWNAIHIGGLDARGHAVNYWYAPGLSTWQFNDLTVDFGGQTMTGGLTGYVTGWDGLNLAGLNATGELIVYWWAPGLGGTWNTINMTTTFSGPTLTGQLDAFVTSWGGINVAGLDSSGQVQTYWWAPFQAFGDVWQTANLSSAGSGPTIAHGVEAVFSADGGINVFGLDSGAKVQLLRWTPADPVWRSFDITTLSSGSTGTLPLGSAAAGDAMLLSTRSAATRTLHLFTYKISTNTWTDTDSTVPIEI